MKLGCYSWGSRLDNAVFDNLRIGASKHGDTWDMIPAERAGQIHMDCDVAIVRTKWQVDACIRKGVPTIAFDKGYMRKPGFWRFSLNEFQPMQFVRLSQCDNARIERTGFMFRSIEHTLQDVVIATSSVEYHEWYGLPEPRWYAMELANQVRQLFHDKRIVYRPKRETEPIPDTVYSDRKAVEVMDCLKTAACVITHGSGIALDALFHVVPVICLGEHPAALAGTREWANNLSYCQWHEDELADGSMWAYFRKRICESHFAR